MGFDGIWMDMVSPPICMSERRFQGYSADPLQVLATLRQRYPRRVLERDAVKPIQAQDGVHTQLDSGEVAIASAARASGDN